MPLSIYSAHVEEYPLPSDAGQDTRPGATYMPFVLSPRGRRGIAASSGVDKHRLMSRLGRRAAAWAGRYGHMIVKAA